ncbi:GRP family sugar transporter [Acetilactobacillus jinshanensis]|uniref:Ribose uptake protein RbsU n=1 Tax=Acetilactobacillus jinshanensis TaxID=1720083 RepID=A0A4P6ZK42_9LACO|nr:GRP family sugar transporter [Acetilactobacillus jinshanensis]QBP18125.1 ribose uptake protein RbsU [Acetilactobacillus jinshanensis]URL60988.1 ribose uptake protein RbsU [uncultured bacterium]
MRIILGLIPALFWGLMPLFLNRFGGKPAEQMLGTVYGAALASVIFYFIMQPAISFSAFAWCFVAGMCWSFGTITQYSAYPEIGVSITMPTSTGSQLVGTSIVGVLFFKSWPGLSDKFIGFLAIAVIVIGVCMTAYQDKSNSGGMKISKANFKAGLMNASFGAIGFIICNSLPKIPQADGFEMIMPQCLGMLTSGILIALCRKQYRQEKPFFKAVTFENMITGFSFAIAEFVYFFSIDINGLSTGFVLSQMCVVISTLLGIYVIKEHKTHKELSLTLSGLVLVVVGGAITGLI